MALHIKGRVKLKLVWVLSETLNNRGVNESNNVAFLETWNNKKFYDAVVLDNGVTDCSHLLPRGDAARTTRVIATLLTMWSKSAIKQR